MPESLPATPPPPPPASPRAWVWALATAIATSASLALTLAPAPPNAGWDIVARACTLGESSACEMHRSAPRR